MVAATEGRLPDTQMQIRNPEGQPLAAEQQALVGTMMGIETAAGPSQGYLVPVTASPTIRVLGLAARFKENLATQGFGANGDKVVWIDTYPAVMENSAGGDAIARQHIGQLCYAADNQTVALTDGEGTRPVAGLIEHVSTEGVRVKFLRAAAPAAGASPSVAPSASLTIGVADLTAAALTQTFTLLASPPAGLYLLYGAASAAFTGGGATLATLDAGINTTNPDLLADAVDVFTAPVAYGPLVGDAGPVAVIVPAGSNDLEVIITSDVNVNLLTTGDASLVLYRVA